MKNRSTVAQCSIQINGAQYDATVGEPLVEVLNRTGRIIPQVCYHPQLGPIQTCDTCMVEVNGQLTRACGTPVAAGMNVVTETNRVDIAQREAFDRILGNHMLYCTVCDNNNENCTVHNTTALLQVKHQQRPYLEKPYPVDTSNPFYRYDPNQCILCGRCVEACQNVQVNETLSIAWESEHPRVLWDGGETIAGSSCVSCGHCVTVCPCNALMEKSMIGRAGFFTSLPKKTLDHMIDVVKGIEPEIGYVPILAVSEIEASMRKERVKKTKTVCTYCGVGCSFDVWTKDRHILKIEPGEGAANGISTCVKGKFGWDFINSEDRLTTPMIREADRFRPASWAEALQLIADRISAIKRDHGPDSIGLIASSKCTNEESYLMQKLARAVIGTNNIDNCSRYCQTPATMGLDRTVGYGGDSGSITDIEHAGLVLIIGSNTSESHPVLATRIKSSHKLHGQRLIVADLRAHEMAKRADLWMRPNPSTDLVWLSAVTKYILDNDLGKPEFVERWVNGFEEYRQSLAPFTMEFAERVTGIAAATLEQVAHEIAGADGVCVLWAMGVTQHCGGSDTSTAISNLLLITGNYMRSGAGAYPLRGHNNVQGASDFGSMPNVYPGYQKVEDPETIQRFEKGWGVKLPTTKGHDNHDMIDAIFDGKLKALYLKGEDTITSDANENRVSDAFKRIEFLVVQEIVMSETARYADVVLPASPSLEKDGTFTNTERRIQRLYQALEPLGESKPDWKIIQEIANALGADWKYEHPSQIMAECASLTPLFAGVNYERLEGYKSLQWPVAADGSDQPLLFTEKFPFPDGKAKLFPLKWEEPCQEEDPEFDLHLNNGRLLEHFEAGNMTFRSAGIMEETPHQFLEISPELAAERGVETGRWVRLRSKFGQTKVQVLVTDRVRGKQLYLPLNSVAEPVNRLTGPLTDRATHTPAYKEATVQMIPLPEQGESPLPRNNFRFGHPTPQMGVEVERKWRRSDYYMPGTGADDKLVQIANTKL
ncbi:MAG TPA: formate dehydrogenase subunit alpha [Acidobacteriaceae bacterium]|nr:formate dehydrogenase subunit alpha [Acidobacteriaceae bacterium]